MRQFKRCLERLLGMELSRNRGVETVIFASQTALGAAVTAVGKTVDGEKELISDDPKGARPGKGTEGIRLATTLGG
jgi:hypothetical protein